jgi:Putative auto-transporter adhesin, head GIN domain
MRKIFLLTVLVASSFLSLGQNEKIIKDQNAQTRGVKGFHSIRVSSGIDLYLSQGHEEAVAVSASDSKYRDRIITEVEDGVLKIYMENHGVHWNWGNLKLKAYVSFTSLDRLGASGGSDVFIENTVKVEKLDIVLSGGSDLKGKVDIRDLSFNLSGGSDVEISGKTATLHVEASGGSDFHGYELMADVCNIRASGGSDANITVNKELNADASGGSDIYYKGSGVVKEVRSSGSGSVSKKG